MTALNKGVGVGVDDRRSSVIARLPNGLLTRLNTRYKRVVLLLNLPPVRPGVEVFAMHTRRGHAHAVHLVDTAMTASRCGVTPAVVIKFSK